MNTTHYTSQFATGAYNNTFIRAVKSELFKLRQRSIMTTATIFGLLILVSLIAVVGVSRSLDIISSVKLSSISQSEPFFLMCAIIIGALAVTSEYSANTMRTTSLATPIRHKAFLAKIVATAIGVGIITTTIILLCVLGLVIVSGAHLHIAVADIYTLLTLIGLMMVLALMSAGVGYLVRSIAATMGIMLALTLLLPLVGIFFLQFETYRTYVPPFYPASLIATALGDNPFMLMNQIQLSAPVAFLILLGYSSIALVLGYLRYRKADV